MRFSEDNELDNAIGTLRRFMCETDLEAVGLNKCYVIDCLMQTLAVDKGSALAEFNRRALKYERPTEITTENVLASILA